MSALNETSSPKQGIRLARNKNHQTVASTGAFQYHERERGRREAGVFMERISEMYIVT
jgi:hypothetical protein